MVRSTKLRTDAGGQSRTKTYKETEIKKKLAHEMNDVREKNLIVKHMYICVCGDLCV